MRIVELITDIRARAGAEVFMANLSLELSKNNEVFVISIWDKPHNSFIDLFKKNNIPFYCCDKTSKKGFLKASIKLRKIIKGLNPDIIHTHLSVYKTYFVAFGFKKQPWDLFHTFHNIAQNESDKLNRILLKKYMKKNIVFPVGISDYITNSIADEYKLNISNISTIYNGFRVRQVNMQNEKEYDLICVARFSPVKNHVFLLKTIKKYIDIYEPIRVCLVGDGELINDCQKYVTDNNLNDFIYFTHSVNDPYEYLLKSKVFVLPSLYEGNPISILEAMNCGLPIIATRVGGIPDVIKDGVNGFLIDVNNEDQLLGSILELLISYSFYKKISKFNIIDVKQYGINICSNKYLKLFAQATKY